MLRCCLYLLSAAVAIIGPWIGGPAAAQPKYLLFQVFIGGPEPQTGICRRGLPKEGLLAITRRIADIVDPPRSDPDRVFGFSVGPIAMDFGADIARSTIAEAFYVALQTDTAVALHLDDYMFWGQARLADGTLLTAANDTAEWKDWTGTPAEGLDIGWLPNVRLPPQMCYESPTVRDFVTYWARDVVGSELKRQVDMLAAAGKPQLFAGVIVGWESNLAYGYCSLSRLGYGRDKLPVDFDLERERVLQRHVERFAKGLFDAGISRDSIFTHLGPIPKSAYDQLLASKSRERIREIHQSTGLRALWTAFNKYSRPGFSGYSPELFNDIYEAVQSHGGGSWAMVEGTNGMPMHGTWVGTALSWEAYLARNFNHGAKLVNLFAGFQGPTREGATSPTESKEALAAYQKFLRGDRLVEGRQP
jgi:hypothetical protein